MADQKISALTGASTPLAGTEVLPIVQGGATVKVSVANLTAGRAVSALSLTSTSDSALNGVSVGLGAGSVASNTICGNGALSTNSSGANLTAVGYQALFNSTGTRNSALGYRAGFNTSSGTYNTFIGGPDGSFGWAAGYSTTIGSFNTALGGGALANNVAADSNSAVGYQSLFLNVSGTQNVGVGNVALRASTGSNNTALGYSAGNSLTSGSNNAFFGSNAQPSAVGVSNEYTYGDASVTSHRFTGGNLVPGTAAKGVNFTANTPAAGMTSQLLNWYEEGTFTAVANVLGSGTITLNTNTCHYTRIGRQVTVTGAISVLSVSSPTGDTQIAGFPFTAGRASAVALQGTGFAATASTALVARLDASTTGFYVFHFAVGTSSGSAADFQAGSSLNFSCTYFI